MPIRIASLRGAALVLCFLCAGCVAPEPPGPLPLRPDAVRVGYWHNWQGRSADYIPLREVPRLYTQVNVAFAVPETNGRGRMTFKPAKETPEAFRRDVQALKSRGTRVVLSVGGGNHPVALRNREEARAFAQSLSSLIAAYGFDGIDLNLEKDSVALDPRDLDFRRPVTPRIVHLIEAVRMLAARHGPGLFLSVSPETQFTVGGHKRYGGMFGGYLPVLHALRDHIDLVHMQYYNSGTQLVFTGRRGADEELIVTKGTPDFVVALTEMLILGFPVALDPSMYFPGLGAERIAVGLPATPSAASGGGYLRPHDLRNAMGYLLTGRAGYPTAYRLRQRGGHPDLAGIMTWSINWDATRDGGTRPYGFVRDAASGWDGY